MDVQEPVWANKEVDSDGGNLDFSDKGDDLPASADVLGRPFEAENDEGQQEADALMPEHQDGLQ